MLGEWLWILGGIYLQAEHKMNDSCTFLKTTVHSTAPQFSATTLQTTNLIPRPYYLPFCTPLETLPHLPSPNQARIGPWWWKSHNLHSNSSTYELSSGILCQAASTWSYYGQRTRLWVYIYEHSIMGIPFRHYSGTPSCNTSSRACKRRGYIPEGDLVVGSMRLAIKVIGLNCYAFKCTHWRVLNRSLVPLGSWGSG